MVVANKNKTGQHYDSDYTVRQQQRQIQHQVKHYPKCVAVTAIYGFVLPRQDYLHIRMKKWNETSSDTKSVLIYFGYITFREARINLSWLPAYKLLGAA